VAVFGPGVLVVVAGSDAGGDGSLGGAAVAVVSVVLPERLMMLAPNLTSYLSPAMER